MTAPAILVGNRTGGQGKTLISQMIHYGYSLAGQPISAVSADSAEVGAESKLGRFLGKGNVDELGTGANMSEVLENNHEAVRYWDRLGKHLRDGSCVVDLGANILPLVFQWARARKAGRLLKGSRVVLVIPVTAQAQSIADAVEMLKLAAANEDVLPISESFLVLNEYHGSFARLKEDRKFEKLGSSTMLGHNTKVVQLTKANVEVWGNIEAKNISFERLAGLGIEDYEELFNLDMFAASGSEAAFDDWNKSTLKGFRDVGLIPPGVEPSAEGHGVSQVEKKGAKAA
jgi:hypothetical protein